MGCIDWAGWLSAVGTILLAFVAAFSTKIASYWKRPKLDLEFRFSTPDCHRTKMRGTQPGAIPVPVEFYAFYYRMRIWNRGNTAAEDVEVIVSDLQKKVGDEFRIDPSFSPDNLEWSTLFQLIPGIRGPVTVTHVDHLPPGTWKFCNLGHVFDPAKRALAEEDARENLPTKDAIFSFEMKFKSTIGYWQLPPGTYRFTIWVAASNARVVERHFEMEVTGYWTEDEDRMLKEGVKARKLASG